MEKDIKSFTENRIKDAFRAIGDARCGFTIWEFQAHIEDNAKELGGAGFIASIGNAMIKATPVESAEYGYHGALEKTVAELERERNELRFERGMSTGYIQALASALNDLIAAFDSHPYLPKEDGELPALDRASAIYGDTVRKLADGGL